MIFPRPIPSGGRRASMCAACALAFVAAFVLAGRAGATEEVAGNTNEVVADAADLPPVSQGPSAESDPPERLPNRLRDSLGFPPVGMRLDLAQEQGHWTFSYRWTRRMNEGLRDDDRDLAVSDVLGQPWTEVPVRQIDDIHEIAVAYAPLDRLTFELSLPYMSKQMDVVTTGPRRRFESRGIGDARFVFIIPFVDNRDQVTHLTAGITFPTGSIDAREGDERLPYSMQLGSGTWDLVYGVTYTGRWERLAWGGQIDGVFRIGHNAYDYKQSTLYEASAWLAGEAHEWVTLTARMGWSRRTNIRGFDAELDPLVNPANDQYKQAWNRLELGPGANVYLPVLGGQRFSVEAMFPVVQVLDGPQLKREWTLTAGFQWLY